MQNQTSLSKNTGCKLLGHFRHGFCTEHGSSNNALVHKRLCVVLAKTTSVSCEGPVLFCLHVVPGSARCQHGWVNVAHFDVAPVSLSAQDRTGNSCANPDLKSS